VIGSGAIVDSFAIWRDMTAQDEALVAGGAVIVQRRALEGAFSRMGKMPHILSPRQSRSVRPLFFRPRTRRSQV